MFSIISVIISEVNIAAEQKQALLETSFLVFISFHCPQLFYCPLLLRSPCIGHSQSHTTNGFFRLG